MALRSQSSEVEEMPRSKYEGKRMTLEEFEALPEEKPYLEYWDGVVLQKAVPKRKHRLVQQRIDVRLAQYSDANGGESGPEAHIWFKGRGYRVPDLSYWAPGRDVEEGDRQLPPTLTVEIRSRGQAMGELVRKCRDMRANGVGACWLIDPETRRAFVFEGDRDGDELEHDGSLKSELMPGFEIRLDELWAVLDR